MASVASTTAHASPVTAGPITSAAPALLNLTAFRTAASEVTSSFSLPISKDQLLGIPLQIASQIERAIAFVWNQVIIEGLGTSILQEQRQRPLAVLVLHRPWLMRLRSRVLRKL